MSRKRTRLFVDRSLAGDIVPIADQDAKYLGRVLRLKRGDELVVFNGRGEERHATVRRLSRHGSELAVGGHLEPLAEPRLEVVLIQSLVKSDAMDTIVQKATELGVGAIYAVKTDFSVVKLDSERAARRVAHWTQVARHACEQCGRHRPPAIHVPSSFAECLTELPAGGARLVFEPGADLRPPALEPRPSAVRLLVGPEGGLSESDLAAADAAGFVHVGLGPRVLRADTAAITACTAAQLLWGDAR